MLEVLALGVALERLHHRLVVLPGKIFTRRSQDGRLAGGFGGRGPRGKSQFLKVSGESAVTVS